MGIPFYGQTFTLGNQAQNGLNAPVIRGGDPGPITKQRGMLAYFEICQKGESEVPLKTYVNHIA